MRSIVYRLKRGEWWKLTPLLWVVVIIASGVLVVGNASAAPQTLTAPDAGTGVPSCAANNNPEYCLPVGRWSGVVAGLSSRTDRADGVMVIFTAMGNMAQYVFNSLIPQIVLTLTQSCWNVALALTSFAARFDVLKYFGKYIDQIVAGMWQGITGTQNAFLAVLVLGLLMMLVGWMGFNANNGGTVGKRILTSVLCIAFAGVLGVQASKDANSSSPVQGSPWWVTVKLNDTMNAVVAGMDFDNFQGNRNANGLLENPYKGISYDCSDYMTRMVKDFKAAQPKTKVMQTVNTMWVETALRSYVTAQLSNPSTSGSVDASRAQDARYIYCHLLDNAANVSPTIQRDLTVPEGQKSYIADTAAQFIFSPQGYIEPWDSAVSDNGDATNTSPDLARQRAMVFWGLCGYKRDGGQAYARSGWTDLLKPLSRAEQIAGNGTYLRASFHGKLSWWPSDWFPDKGSLGSSPLGEKEIISKDNSFKANEFCQAVLQNKPSVYSEDNEKNLKTAADIGWTVDIPNTTSGFKAAGFFDSQVMSKEHAQAAVQVIKTSYGVVGRDLGGMWGSLFASVANMVVWSLLAMVMLLSKLSLVAMGMSLFVVVLARAVPFGGFDDAPKKWFKRFAGASMVGVLYSLLGGLDQIMVNVFADWLAPYSGNFIYNLLIGLAPLVSMWLIGEMSKALGKGNPFSMKAMVGSLAGGQLLLNGAAKLKSKAGSMMRGAQMRRMMRKKAKSEQGSRHAQARKGQGNRNAEQAMRAQHAKGRNSKALNNRMKFGEQPAIVKKNPELFKGGAPKGMGSPLQGLIDGKHKYMKSEIQGAGQRKVAARAAGLNERAKNLKVKAELLAENGHGIRAKVANAQSKLAAKGSNFQLRKLHKMSDLTSQSGGSIKRGYQIASLSRNAQQLQSQVKAKEAEVSQLMKRQSAGGATSAGQVAQARAELESAKKQLADADRAVKVARMKDKAINTVGDPLRAGVGQMVAHQSLGKRGVRQVKFSVRRDLTAAQNEMGW